MNKFQPEITLPARAGALLVSVEKSLAIFFLRITRGFLCRTKNGFGMWASHSNQGIHGQPCGQDAEYVVASAQTVSRYRSLDWGIAGRHACRTGASGHVLIREPDAMVSGWVAVSVTNFNWQRR